MLSVCADGDSDDRKGEYTVAPVIGQFRPAPVRLDTVGQTQRNKVERKNDAQTEQAALQNAAIPNRPAAVYTPGVQTDSTEQYRVGQEADRSRNVYVSPVAELAMSVARRAEE